MQFSAISWREQATFDVMTLKSLCTKPTRLEFNSVISLKQQSAERHVAPLENIILIPKQPVVVHSPYCCVLSAEAITTNFIVLDLTRPGWGGGGGGGGGGGCCSNPRFIAPEESTRTILQNRCGLFAIVGHVSIEIKY